MLLKNSREMGTLRVERMHPGVGGGGTLVGVDIFMHRCAYLRSGSDQVVGGVSFVWKDLVGIAILT